jgi:hypothetical protein
MMDQTAKIEAARKARLRIAQHLADLHRVHLALAEESRGLKNFTMERQATVEIEVATEMLEQYLNATGGFLENMRGRFEARLGVLRQGDREDPHGHGNFWLSFSRLCAVLRRADTRAGS